MPPHPADRTLVDHALLAAHPLPDCPHETSKVERGTVLVIGGSSQTPGAAMLSGLAALRAGAGRLQILTEDSVARGIAIALPEARVIGVAASGCDPSPEAVARHSEVIAAADAVILGPGAIDHQIAAAQFAVVAEALGPEASLVVDAGALAGIVRHPEVLAAIAGRAVIIPNVSEAGHLLDSDRDVEDPSAAADELAERLGVVACVRAAKTFTSAPDGSRFIDHSGSPTLATSGSGDVVSGIVGGLAARGADPLTAALWAIHVHGRAGELRAGRDHAIGMLARELLDLIVPVMAELTDGR